MLRSRGRQSILHSDRSYARSACTGVDANIPDLKRARIYRCRPPVAHGMQFHDPLFGTCAHAFHETKRALPVHGAAPSSASDNTTLCAARD